MKMKRHAYSDAAPSRVELYGFYDSSLGVYLRFIGFFRG